MAQPISHVINKASHWPIEQQRAYLILALKCEKDRRRRSKISKALRDMTTNVLKTESRGVCDKDRATAKRRVRYSAREYPL